MTGILLIDCLKKGKTISATPACDQSKLARRGLLKEKKNGPPGPPALTTTTGDMGKKRKSSLYALHIR